METLRGIEGEAASLYFSVFDDLILQQKEDFSFTGRNRRPPLDAVNALLSFVYTLLAQMNLSALETAGLDPYVGFMHSDRPGFSQKENGAVMMDEDTRKAVLSSWQARKQEMIRHPFLDEKVEWGMTPYAQALLLTRYIRGDLDEYPPFMWK